MNKTEKHKLCEINLEMFMARFKRLCIEKCRSERISLDILANNIGIAKKTVLKLNNIGIAKKTVLKLMDGSVPKMDTLIMIANYFGVSLDYLAAMDAARDPRFVSFFNAKYKEEQ